MLRAKKLFFKECNLHGRMYHDCDEVFDELKVGTVLSLVREPDNNHDPDAIAVTYYKVVDGVCIDKYLLGYIPRESNKEMATIMDMGWGEIFECRINKINRDAHYEQQIHLTIRINPNPNAEL